MHQEAEEGEGEDAARVTDEEPSTKWAKYSSKQNEFILQNTAVDTVCSSTGYSNLSSTHYIQ